MPRSRRQPRTEPVAVVDLARATPQVLRDYALLADGERGILVGPRGDLAWMCFPGWDSEALFSSLIGGAGSYAITPRDPCVWGGYYEPASLIWRSRWVTVDNAIIECRDALALPAQPDRAIILRRLIARQATAHVTVALNPRGAFGHAPLRRLARNDAGHWRGQVGNSTSAGSAARTLGWQAMATGAKSSYSSSSSNRERNTTSCWSSRRMSMSWCRPTLLSPGQQPKLLGASACLRSPTQSPSAMPATPTPCSRDLPAQAAGWSLRRLCRSPERAREGRNYDYRYVWIRDQCYAGQAVAAAGAHPLLDDAVRFVRDRLLDHGAHLKPAYTTTGGRVPDQQQVDLAGYPGGTNVVGNWVNEQFQLDAFGESLLLFAAAAGHDRLEVEAWRAAEVAAAAVETRWREPDAGIWEIEPDQWTHSRLICAAGLRAISAHAPSGRQSAHWLALADAITADTSARALHPCGRWQRSPSDPRLDAALLLPAIRGAIPHDDPRSLSTLRAFQQELTREGYAYRYRPDDRPLGEAEGAFLLCGFIMSLAYGQQGNQVEAARWFERNRAACGPPGLFSEEFDVTQRQLRGNLPQAFVHALLLECAAKHYLPEAP